MARDWAIRFAAADRVFAAASTFIGFDATPDDHALAALQEALTHATIVLPKAAADICRAWLTEARSPDAAIDATRRHCDHFGAALREHFTDP
jgi:hypothetical protein